MLGLSFTIMPSDNCMLGDYCLTDSATPYTTVTRTRSNKLYIERLEVTSYEIEPKNPWNSERPPRNLGEGAKVVSSTPTITLPIISKSSVRKLWFNIRQEGDSSIYDAQFLSATTIRCMSSETSRECAPEVQRTDTNQLDTTSPETQGFSYKS
ncbi:hypothetical protein PZA11_002372 [Diplocarpon coronariae]